MTKGTPREKFAPLNTLCYEQLFEAYKLAKSRGNPYVEVAHWFHQILSLPDSDIHRIFSHFKVDLAVCNKDLTETLDGLSRGASASISFSHTIYEVCELAFLASSMDFHSSAVRSGHLLYACLKNKDLRFRLLSFSDQFSLLNAESLYSDFETAISGSPEEGSLRNGIGQTGAQAEDNVDQTAGVESALKKYTSDMTEDARQGRIDTIVGRDQEIRLAIDILMRRRQNNPILTGEAGVGKTAIVEGLAKRIADGDVPPSFRSVRLLSLDVGALSAGASMKGEFENRLKQVIKEVQASAEPIILFIDEAHTLIGAGGQAGTGDAANLLKPPLARGELRTIAATTWAEYKKYIEKDPALTRRFQVVKVDEPDDERAIAMMRAITPMLERHHQVRILDEAVIAAVTLSRRYLADRQLPDKAVSLIDTACARIALSQQAMPARIEDVHRRMELAEREIAIRDRETRIGIDNQMAVEKVKADLEDATNEKAALFERWEREKNLVEKIFALRDQLTGEDISAKPAANSDQDGEDQPAGTGEETAQPDDKAGLIAQLKAAERELTEIQGDDPLIFPSVNEGAVAQTIAEWTGIPVGRMVADEVASVLSLGTTLKGRVVGQDTALDAIAKRVKTARAGLADPQKPVGVFMLCGPSGVGKTETALALAEGLYGGERNLITLNMSEFQESHTVSTLKGAPPGYVGYGEGGRLTEAVRRKPYSVILLDEVEKAHSDVHEVFFQVFDKGAMEDGEGRLVDFKNCLILLTSNVGDEILTDYADRAAGVPDLEGAQKALRPALLSVFPPALLGRMIILPYYPLSDRVLDAIIEARLRKIGDRVQEGYATTLSIGDTVVQEIRGRCQERESGGRVIDAVLTNAVLPLLSEQLLEAVMNGHPINKASLGAEDGKFIVNLEGL